MKRLAAVVVAVGLVAGAVALRDALDDDAPSATGGDPPTGQLRLVCATELATACEELADGDVEVTVEEPGQTSDRLVELGAGEDPGFDAWLVDGPWDRITTDNRRFAGDDSAVLGEPSEVLAHSPAVIVATAGAAAEIEADCGGTLDWACIGGLAPGLRIGLPEPERGDGLVVLAAATNGFLGGSDYAANDFDDPEFGPWFSGLTSLSTRTDLGQRSPVEALLTQRGLFDVVGALEAQAAPLLAGRDGVRSEVPDPSARAEVRLVPVGDVGIDVALDALGGDSRATEVLDGAGWRAGAASDGAGLPAAGVLQRLREMW